MLSCSVHKTTGASRVQQQQQQPSNMSGLQQCMPAIDVPLLADSSDQLGMDSDDLVPTLTVCLHQSYYLPHSYRIQHGKDYKFS